MLSIGSLTLFNVITLLAPPQLFVTILELMAIPFSGRTTLLLAAVINVALSMAYEQWGAQIVSQAVGSIMRVHRNFRIREGKTYKAIEGGIH